jgi:hypothetical protein
MEPIVITTALLAGAVAGLVVVGFMGHRDIVQAITRMDRSATAAEHAADAAREAAIATREAAKETGRIADAVVDMIRKFTERENPPAPPAPAE